MRGQQERIGDRLTYFPPFVNEVFGDPPYWSCTFASLLNAANVGWLGQKEASVDEIQRLARASGDENLRGGSRSGHMIRAVRKLYGPEMRIEALSSDAAVRRLANGWALVAGVTYGNLPRDKRFGSFVGGHRMVCVGFDRGRTRLLDPLAERGRNYTGEWIDWADFTRAWWAGEQLWFREGMFVPWSTSIVTTLDEPGRWTVKAGADVAVYSEERPGIPVRRLRPAKDTGAKYQAIVELAPRIEGFSTDGRRYLQVANGSLAGLLIDVATPGVTLVDGPAAAAAASRSKVVGAPAGTGGAAQVTGPTAADSPLTAFSLGRRQEYARVAKAFAKDGKLPPAPPG